MLLERNGCLFKTTHFAPADSSCFRNKPNEPYAPNFCFANDAARNAKSTGAAADDSYCTPTLRPMLWKLKQLRFLCKRFFSKCTTIESI